ncbi:Phosphoglucosamine mutase [Planctomycetes bacterium Pan216]|uniref:Phosphoglucosamine mutase n=1 Tax=Kolteria novifilia TaxID=2527975 RepID=A0A518BBQ1_9BACT|nr:Phosphoglucosamine mutase [Planctomycetes bacterium Pan216]
MPQPSADYPLIVGVSGIRGIVGHSLTPDVVTKFAACFGTPRSGKTIVVSRDGRSSGEMLVRAATAGLLAVGCDVLDLGIASTPTCGFMVKEHGAAGGLQVTASHNPPQWNGLKLFRPEGFVLSPDEGQRVAEDYHADNRRYAEWESIGNVHGNVDAYLPHLHRVLSLVDADAIRRRHFRVVLDANHASGAVFAPRLLEMLDCQLEILGAEPNGRFEHMPEPIEENLGGLAKAVREARADIGFAVDPDGDRLAVVDGTGRYIGEEYTLALSILHRLAQKTGPVVLNGSTSRVSEEAARRYDCPVFRTKVGEVHVAERMLAEGAVIGGEGNGGVIDPRVGMGRDSSIAMALLLELLTTREQPLAEIVDELPRFEIEKRKFSISGLDLAALFDRIKIHFADGDLDTADGIRVTWKDSWVQIRASNTEPIVRVFAEARDRSRANELCDQVHRLIEIG